MVPELRPAIGPGVTAAWRYTVLVPVEEVRSDGTVRDVATLDDIDSLEATLADHFGGLTVPTAVPSIKGFGARAPGQPQTREVNRHAAFIVYAVQEASDQYFLALRRELEEARREGVILVERLAVTSL